MIYPERWNVSFQREGSIEEEALRITFRNLFADNKDK